MSIQNERRELIRLVHELSDNQTKLVKAFIQKLLNEKPEDSLTDEQKSLLDLLNHTISTDRGDFAEKHDKYIRPNK